MNNRGMTAFVDAMVFMMILLIAIGVGSKAFLQTNEPATDPDEVLGVIVRSEVRLSDLTDLEDDTLIHLTDVIAYSLNNDCDIKDYLEDILERVYGKGRFSILYSYGSMYERIGDTIDHPSCQSKRSVPVSIGGTLELVLSTL